MKHFENRSVFDEVMLKILLVPFFPDTVYSDDCVSTVLRATSTNELKQVCFMLTETESPERKRR